MQPGLEIVSWFLAAILGSERHRKKRRLPGFGFRIVRSIEMVYPIFGTPKSGKPFPLLLLLSLLIAGGCNNSDGRLPVFLNDLQVDGAKTALNPFFDPEIFRYSIIAGDQADVVNFTPFADPFVLITINGHLTTSGVTNSITTLTVGDVVQIEAKGFGPRRGDSAEYEIVYLPSDFPELNVTVLEDDVSPDLLYVNLNGPNSNYVAILDNHGVPIFYRQDQQRVFDFKLHTATGERSYARFTGARNQWGRRDSELVVLDSSFNEVDRITTVGLSHTDMHDFLIQPNDELVLLAYDGSLRDLTAFGLSAEELVEDSVVQIVDRATRQVLFEWNSWGQVPYEDQLYVNQRGEYAHVNSVFVDSDGNIIISAQGTSQVVKISRPGGQVLWKLGGKSNQFEFINDPFSHLCGQHTASRLENGNLLLFDNGVNCWPINAARVDLTRVVEYKIDELALQAELVWSYTQDGAYARFQGSAQRLANGNTLIGWGSHLDILATEVNSQGLKVFEITAFQADEPVIGYRARRFPE